MTDEQTFPGWRRAVRLHRMSWVVLVTFVAIAIAMFATANRLADQQEHRLLQERTAEVGLVLSGSLGTAVQSSMSSLATAAKESPTAFAAAAKKASSSTTTIALLTQRGTSWVVQDVAGAGLRTGETITGPRQTFVDSVKDKIHSEIFPIAPGQTRLAMALGAPATPAGTVIYEEYVVDPTKALSITESEPFHELNAALYVGSKVDPAKLVLSTASSLPLHGRVATSPVTIGGDTWLVAASARQPLAGKLTSSMPAILLTAILLIGLAMTALVEGMSRRRDYAVALVDERTMELRQSLDQLEKAQQALVANERLAALGQMAATVGHELRNPLGVLTNSLYLIRLATSTSADDRLNRQLDTADREIAAATLIVSDLLEFSRPRTANPVSTDVVELLAEAVSVAPPPTGIEVEQVSDAVPPVVADRDQVRQVILNLLTNAYEAMPDGGIVRLGARIVDDAVEIAVSDTGVGMDEQTRAQIFEPFFSKKIKGTGLGLAVSKRIANSHGGSLSISSREGEGSTATLSLPLTMTGAGARK